MVKSLKTSIFLLCMLACTMSDTMAFFAPLRAQLRPYTARLAACLAQQKSALNKQKALLRSALDKEVLFRGALIGCFLFPMFSFPESKEEKKTKKLTKRLFGAVKNNNVSEVQMLLNQGAKPNMLARKVGLAKQVGDSRWTPAHVAGYHCYDHIYGLLAAHGADVAKKDKKGTTPAEYMAQCAIGTPF